MRNNGFSLTEALLVAVTVAVFGALILRLFVESERAADKAAELDHAVAVSVYLIDEFKSHADVDSFLSDTGLLPYTITHGMDASVTLMKFYDASWASSSEEGAAYTVRLSFKPDPVYGVALYVVQAEVYRQAAEPVLITVFTTSRYLGM